MIDYYSRKDIERGLRYMFEFRIPAENLEAVLEELNKLKKKYNNNDSSFDYSYQEIVEKDGVIVNKYIDFVINADILDPKWIFVAFLEKREAGILINGWNTNEHSEYLVRFKENIELYCEHCGKLRELKYAVVVRNKETGEYKTLGKQCLKKYTGSLSVERIERKYESVFNGIRYIRDTYCPYMGNPHCFEKSFVIRVAEAVLNNFRYMSGNKAIEVNAIPTRAVVEEVISLLFSNHDFGDLPMNPVDDMIETAYNRNSTFKADIDNIRKDMEGIEADELAKIVDFINKRHCGNSDFDNNMRVVFGNTYVDTRKDLGILVYGVFEYMEALRNANITITNEYVGNIGDKIEFQIADIKSTGREDFYGNYIFYHTFKDDKGHVIIWKTQKAVNKEDIGKTIKGTIKDHTEYKNIKQTYITRCSIR